MKRVRIDYTIYSPDVGLHSIPGILLFDIICCTKIPEFSKACALKNRIGIDAVT
jgi:hypothetical protein